MPSGHGEGSRSAGNRLTMAEQSLGYGDSAGEEASSHMLATERQGART